MSTTSHACCWHRSKAYSPVAASATVYPFSAKIAARVARMLFSSSTTKISFLDQGQKTLYILHGVMPLVTIIILVMRRTICGRANMKGRLIGGPVR